MCSKIKLHVSSVGNEALSPILSIHHYLGRIELFEYTVPKHTYLWFASNEPAFFMSVNFQNNACQLNYKERGSYSEIIDQGLHKTLVITYNYDWFIYKVQKMKPINLLSPFYEQRPENHIRFPSFNMANVLFKAFYKMVTADSELKQDDDGFIFVNSALSRYYKKLVSKTNTQTFHQYKAAKIKAFVYENFTSSIVEDLPGLAEKFMLSERNLARIAKLAFGIPLHDQVIKLRIQASFQQLTATNKPINEIAIQTGYNDPHYFSKAFKKHFGVSPKRIPRPRRPIAWSEIQE